MSNSSYHVRLYLNHQPLLWGIVSLISLCAAIGITRLSFEDDPQNLYRQNNQHFAEMETLQEEFGSFDDEILVLVSSNDLFSREGIGALRSMVKQFREVDEVAEVFSMLDARRNGSKLVPLIPYADVSPERYAQVAIEARRHPLVAGHFLAAESDSTLILIQLDGKWPTIYALKPVVEELRRITGELTRGADLRASMSGMPIIRLDSLATVQREQLKFTVLALLLSTAIAWLVFRQLFVAFVATSAPLIGTFWALGVMGWFGVRINGFNMLLPTLVLLVGFTDAVHLLVDIRRSLAQGQSRNQAAANAVDRLGAACFLTSLTTAIGFGSLMLSRTVSISEFGWVCACGAILSFLSVMLLIPLIASSPLERFLLPRATDRNPNNEIPPTLFRRLSPVLRFPRTRVVIAAVLVAILAPLPWRMTPDVKSTEAIPKHSETILTLRECDIAFGGSLPVFVVLQWPDDLEFLSQEVLAALTDVQKIVKANDTLSDPFSILNVLQSLPGKRTVPRVERYLVQLSPRLNNRLLRRDLHKLVISSRVLDVGAAAAQPTWEQLELEFEEFEKRHPGFKVHITGRTVVAGRNLRQIIRDLSSSLALAAVLIVGVLTIVFRTWVVGLISIIPNTLPLLTNAALLEICDLPLQLTSVLTFSLCLGLAVDDTIHFLMRYSRERRAGWSVEQALLRTYYFVGGVLIATSVILISGFAVIMLSAVPALRLFAMLTCAAVFSALVGDLVILPAFLQCFASRSTKIGADRTKPVRESP